MIKSKFDKCSKHELIEMVETLDRFNDEYRKLIINRGILTEEELTRYDIGICERYMKEIAPFLFEKIEKNEA